jgi:16S rRNA (cytosine967-C5)-methyltransferase
VTPSARLAAAIEVLDDVSAQKAPADQVLKAWGKKHRFAGSGDRRAIAERTYQCLRARAQLAWAMGAPDGRALVLGALRQLDRLPVEDIDTLFSGEGHAPPPLTSAERKRLDVEPDAPPPEVAAGVPEFIARALEARFGETWMAEAKALVQPRAPVDLRVNGLAGGLRGALNLLERDGIIDAEPSPLSARGLRLPPQFAADIQKTRPYTTGWIEVQDEGSQIAAALAGARPGWLVVDYCAGGGGKTLALAAQMQRQSLQDDEEDQVPRPPSGDKGRLVACDVNKRRLDAIPERLKRAGAKAELRLTGQDGQGTEDLAGLADLVLVDAPCSGSGTWRRRPEGAWRLTPDDVARLAALQLAILTRASGLVKPGGRLAYVTCSILSDENDAVAEAFAAARPEFRPVSIAAAAATPDLTEAGRARLAELAEGGHTVQLTPHRTGTDGFFIALFERS